MPERLLTTHTALKNGRPTIAVLIGTMISTYHEGIMRGAAYVAEEKGYNIIGYCGGVLNSAYPLTLARDKVFDLVDMDLIAGIISPFSSHTRYLDKQESQQFIDRFASVPLINIGSHIENHTNIETDYETGFIELFEHFYHQHNCRKFLLVRGPEYHASSNSRMDIYQKLLKQYHLPFNEEMIIYSNLNRGSAKSDLNAFLDSTNQPFDAIITVNDNSALGIMDACKERGIRIPEDVAIVGSMNTLAGSFSTPTLTTIEEPLFELGRAAATELILQIEGKAACSEIRIPTSLIVRQSCGCESSALHDVHQTINQVASPFNKESDPIYNETETYCLRISEQYKGGVVRNELPALLALYQQAIYSQNYDRFISELQFKLNLALKSEDIMLWLAIMAKLQLSTLCYLELDKEAHSLISFTAKLVALKNEVEQTAIKFRFFETEYYLNYFRAIVNNLNSSFDFSTIKKYTVDIMKLTELYISLLDDADEGTFEEIKATNIASVRNNQSLIPTQKNYSAKQLIPNGIPPYTERYTLMVFPLAFRNNPIGFMTLNLSDCKGAAFENLRATISSALKNEILIQDLKKAEERFSDIAHSTSNWLWETDVNNQFTYCSKSSSDIIGYPPEALLSKSINALNIEEGDSYIKSMLSHENLVEVESWYKHKNGKVICLLTSAKPIITEGVFCGYRGVFDDITDQKLQADKIKHLAYSDVLTGLPNRTMFQEKLSETMTFSSHQNKKFGLMFIDLDHFKHINDSMGHAAGDLLLIKLSERLTQSIRSKDTLSRLGGDEFIAILPDIVNEDDIIDIAERIFNNLKEPIVIHNKPVYSTLSLGISVFPTDAGDAQSLLQKGDNAMYQAKSQGRNNYVFYNKLLEEKHALRHMYEEILREAIDTGGFTLRYQPQVSTLTGEVLGFEALVRIEDSKQGLVAPEHFIPIAEELGLMGLVDEWVFEAVCAQYSTWRSLGFKSKRLSINLSAVQLHNDSAFDTYLQIMKRHEVSPKDLRLEVTEKALADNQDLAINTLQKFKDYGLSIALDNIGASYSSLNCINAYPIDTIKIDRTFIHDAISSVKNKTIIQGIVLIASNLHLKIISERIETEQEYEFIKQLGCDEIQGYFCYKPCSAEAAQKHLEKCTPQTLKTESI